MTQAKYPGTCSQCKEAVTPGMEVRFQRSPAGRFEIVACPACSGQTRGQTRGNSGNGNGGGHHRAPVGQTIEARVRIQGIRTARPDWAIVSAVLDGPQGAGFPADTFIEDGRAFTAVGPFGANIRVGDILDVRGHAVRHDTYGSQLRVSHVLPAVAATDAGLVAFLRRFPGIGVRRAEQVLRVLGGRAAVIDALEHDPCRLTGVPGITMAKAQAIADEYMQTAGMRDVLFFLAELGVAAGSRLEAQVIEAYGPDAKLVIAEDPYQLMELPGVGFSRADEIARRLGITEADPRRTTAAVRELIDMAEREGHTWSTIDDLYELANPRRGRR